MAACSMRFVIAPAILLISACEQYPQHADGIAGTYRQEPLAARDGAFYRTIVGEWKAEFRVDGHLMVREQGGANWWIESTYRLDGDILTINDLRGTGSCRPLGADIASATYRVHLTATEISYVPLRDECYGRRTGMTMHPWLRVR